MDSYINLNYWELAAASIFVFINAGLSIIFRLNIHRSLLIAALRMAVQLAFVGLVLMMLSWPCRQSGPALRRSGWCCSPDTKQRSGSSGGSLAGGPTDWFRSR